MAVAGVPGHGRQSHVHAPVFALYVESLMKYTGRGVKKTPPPTAGRAVRGVGARGLRDRGLLELLEQQRVLADGGAMR